MARLRLWGVVVTVGLSAAACTRGGTSADPSGSTVADGSAPPTTVAGTTDVAPSSTDETSPTTTPTATPTTAAPPATTTTATATPPPTTTVACEFEGSVEEVAHEFPHQMSAEVGADIRVGAHPCFERVVIELVSTGDAASAVAPGYLVRYATGPLTLGQTDDQFVELAGDADLLITTNAWMTSMDSPPVGYSGPIDFVPTNVEVIQQLRMLDNFEGQNTWAVGLDHERPFGVQVLTNPTRIVVDISNE